MKHLKLVLIIVSILFLINGCTPKEPEIIYVKRNKYEFQKVDFTGAFIDLKELTEDQRNMCIPKLQELNTIYSETKSFYDSQFDDYNKDYEQFNKKETK